ncbi:MAG: 3-deoxy-manno-octulosonate cytidylyltransferase, partial [Planctomycetaceae bacterium]|nr:3-deoxy-manno-octulosonate cytidylyltransferase [Planctomycetaceae bacterium]
MATAATPLDPDDAVTLDDPHTVKVFRNSNSTASGFFRKISNIPAISTCLRHIGLYAYRTDFLLRLAELPPSTDSLREDLEQLTPLALGATIRVAIVPASSAGNGIDTPDDYRNFVQRIASGAPHPQPRGKG